MVACDPPLMFRLPVCLLATLLLCIAGAATATEPAAAPTVAVSAGTEPSSDDLLNGYNHLIVALNRTVYWLLGGVLGSDKAAASDSLSSVASAPGALARGEEVPPPLSPAAGPGRVISNLVNEPLTALSSLAVGDMSTAWNAVQRFGINSTVGVLGWWDEASTMGYEPEPADIGLSLCRMGVGEGGYVMLAFVGPRTYRDGVADIVLVNALMWTATAAIFTGGMSLQTIIIAETIELTADIVATRQIDPRAKELGYNNYEKQRADYLTQRRARCAGHLRVAVAETPTAR